MAPLEKALQRPTAYGKDPLFIRTFLWSHGRARAVGVVGGQELPGALNSKKVTLTPG